LSSAIKIDDDDAGYAIYVLDTTVSRLPSGQEKFAAVADLEGWGYSNCDIRGYLAALDIMQNYYPERLGRVFLIHVPYVFMAAWKIVYPFIDDNTKKKFVFVSDKDVDKTLREAIDETQLLEEYGGKLKLVSGKRQ
jgi:hypothetical protein